MGFLDRFAPKPQLHPDEQRWLDVVASSSFLGPDATKPGTVRRLKALRLAMLDPASAEYGFQWDQNEAASLVTAIQRFPSTYTGSVEDTFGRSLSFLKVYYTNSPFEIANLAEAMGASNASDRGVLSGLTLGVLSEIGYLGGGPAGPWMNAMSDRSMKGAPVEAEMSAWIAMAMARLFANGPMGLHRDEIAYLETL